MHVGVDALEDGSAASARAALHPDARGSGVHTSRVMKRKRRSRDKSYGLTFNGQYILLLHTKMTPYNIRPFWLLTDRFRWLFSVFAVLCHEINVSVFLFSARGEHWGQTLSECACELSLPAPSLPLPATKCCLYVSLKLTPRTQFAITRRVFSRKLLPTPCRKRETTLSISLFSLIL